MNGEHYLAGRHTVGSPPGADGEGVNGYVAVGLPSDRFTAYGRRTLTLEEWRAAHERAYPTDDADEPAA